MPVEFFGFPTEIRLKIYWELLVLSKPIVFIADFSPSLPPVILSKRDGLYPARPSASTSTTLSRHNDVTYRHSSDI